MTKDNVKTIQTMEVMLPSKWAVNFRPKAFRPAVVGDWVYLPVVDRALKLTAAHKGSLGVCHLILEPPALDPKEWWPKWLKARWLFGSRTSTNRWVWTVSNAKEAPTPNPYDARGSFVTWGYWGDLRQSMPLIEWMVTLSPNLIDLSFIPDVEPKDACFKNPWLDEEAS